MAKITASAAARFKKLFEELDYENAAIRLGTRPKEPDSTEHYIDFIPDKRVNMLNDVVFVTNGVMVAIKREDEEALKDTVINYIDDPQGFVFETENNG